MNLFHKTFFLILSLREGLSKGTLKTTIEVAIFELCNFSTIHSPGRGLRPLQPPGHYQQLPARNELRRRKENNFFPSLTKF